jgi:type IV secretion system protein TrbB
MGKFEDELILQERRMENLLCDLKKLIPLFETKTITDIFVYGNGNVSVSDFDKGAYDTDIILSIPERLRIIYSLSSVVNIPIDKWERPTLESVIPKYNIRTTAIIDPWVPYPEITFRRPADKIHTLEDYLAENRITQELYDKIISHIKIYSNIVISGSTGSGKTTFTNACLDKMYDLFPKDRLYIVEDTYELQYRDPKKTQLYIRPNQAVASIQTAMRWTPVRIIFGEIRYGEVANEMLKAWVSGHPGITTIHADSAAATIPRIEGLLREVIKGQIPDLAESVHLIVHLKNKRVVEALTVREIREGKQM